MPWRFLAVILTWNVVGLCVISFVTVAVAQEWFPVEPTAVILISAIRANQIMFHAIFQAVNTPIQIPATQKPVLARSEPAR